MKGKQKIKLNKLNFYIIDDRYINYLKEFESHIAYNKNEKRPYIGVVLKINEHQYFAPLFSPKLKHKTYKNNLTFFKIVSKDKKELGIIRFSDMIPVKNENISLLDMNSKSYGYKRLLSEQYSYINKTKNKDKILEKAERIYTLVTKENSKSKVVLFYKNISCNFKKLEVLCEKYLK